MCVSFKTHIRVKCPLTGTGVNIKDVLGTKNVVIILGWWCNLNRTCPILHSYGEAFLYHTFSLSTHWL
jgi:hypothetical protein